MEGGKMSSSSSNHRALLLPSDRFPSPSGVLDSFWVPNSNPSFQASASMVNFNDSPQEMEHSNEDYTGCFLQPEKKRRLSPEQVHFLEQSFEVENRLEPERKVQLAKELGLHPRQVAIWFQNRRARYKTKHIEKEYDSLKTSFNQLKADFDSLSLENEKLRNEVQVLTEKMESKEKGKAQRETSEPVVNRNGRKAQLEEQIHSRNSQNGVSSPIVMCKQEDAASSAKSDVFDSDSPVYTDGIHSSFPADSSHVLDSDFSRSLFPKLQEEEEEEEEYHSLQMPPNASGLGYSIEDQMTSWFWS
ncbi:unnamed protein product [Cuscuta epithymum]|uniref:Homeobox-leucine zipper protein n=1 Tax=Cuscuta epithymum TaxID=186058 RepID=A0AAV0D127_9ASTE|nr:unnamed protein product [Cuscuta epithymum]